MLLRIVESLKTISRKRTVISYESLKIVRVIDSNGLIKLQVSELINPIFHKIDIESNICENCWEVT